MEPIYVERHCDLLTKESFFEEMTKDLEQVDLFLVGLEIARGDLVVELAQRTKKPVMIVPENCCMIGDCVPAMRVRGLEAYGHYCWEDAAKQMQALRLRKVMAHTNVLQVVRFNSNNAIASDATFYSENEVTRLLGTKFRGINLHELIDQFVPGDPMANHCTPGRMGVNPTAEDIKEIERITDELLAGACEVGMEKDKLMVSVRMWYTVMKMLELYDCNAFVAPCPDSCATRRMNEEQFTFCLTHSLNNEIGIPSACEYDVGALLSMQVLNSVSGCAAYMGNTNLLMYENGVAQPRRSVSEEDLKDIKNEPNLCFTFHSTPNRKLHGYDKPNSEYGIQPFAYEAARDGDTTAGDVAACLTPRTRLAAVTQVSNLTGAVLPLREIIAAAHAQDIPVLVDGAQGVRSTQTDMQALGCDFYCFSGHKTLAPTGTGALYMNEALQKRLAPVFFGGGMVDRVNADKTTFAPAPHCWEAGTPNYAGAIALASFGLEASTRVSPAFYNTREEIDCLAACIVRARDFLTRGRGAK